MGFDGKTCDPSRAINFMCLRNDVRHQFKGYACGMYSLYAILRHLALGETLESFLHLCNDKIPDDVIWEYRTILFTDAGK